jgi:glycerophosphoryl diester phosphodiesterase
VRKWRAYKVRDLLPLFLSIIAEFAQATFTFAKGQRPQCIAHRGYKAKYPENTMGAFKAALDIGVHAIETDIHLSKDGVVVLSHVGASGTKLGFIVLTYTRMVR